MLDKALVNEKRECRYHLVMWERERVEELLQPAWALSCHVEDALLHIGRLMIGTLAAVDAQVAMASVVLTVLAKVSQQHALAAPAVAVGIVDHRLDAVGHALSQVLIHR